MAALPKAPFPKWRSFVICLAMFSCAFNMSVLFPFVPVLVEDLGMVEDPRKPGYYAGLMIAAPQLGRILTSVCWGAVADKYGRMPVARISLVMTALTAVAFGVCTNYWLAVALRGLNGLCDFMLGIAKMLITELIDPVHQPRAMSYLGAGWGLAVIIGPTIGGILARPAVNFPDLVSADSFFGQHPYALPNFFTAALCTLGCLGLHTLPEPLLAAKPLCGGWCRHRGAAKGEVTHDGLQVGAADGGGSDEDEEERLLGPDGGSDEESCTDKGEAAGGSSSCVSFCADEKPRLAIAFYTIAMAIEFADPMIMSLWASAPRSSRGLGYSTSEIGSVLAITGLTLIVCQTTIYIPLNKHLGTLGMLRLLVIAQVSGFFQGYLLSSVW